MFKIFFYFVLILGSVFAQDLCQLEPSSVAEDILLIGALASDRVLLLTKSGGMYDLHPMTLGESSLNLTSARPSALEARWPELAESPVYRRYRQSGLVANSVPITTAGNSTNQTKELLIFSLVAAAGGPSLAIGNSSSHGQVSSFIYNLTSKKVERIMWSYEESSLSRASRVRLPLGLHRKRCPVSTPYSRTDMVVES